MTSFPVTTKILERYAEVIVHCGCNFGEGIKPGEVVLVVHNQLSAPLVPFLQAVITKAGGHMITDAVYEYTPEQSPQAALAAHGDDAQLDFYPLEHLKTLYAMATHCIELKALTSSQPDALVSNPAYQRRLEAMSYRVVLLQQFRVSHWVNKTLAHVPTPALAEQSGVTLDQFWDQVIKACYLDKEDAVGKTREAMHAVAEVATRLTALQIHRLHIVGTDIDMKLGLHESALWVSAQGGNIPSFECYTTPMATQTEGWVRFAFPMLYQGHQIKGLYVRFEAGRVVDWSATGGEEAFAALMAINNADRLGEIAFTDERLSRIDIPLPGAALWLENVGGTGHMAFGFGYEKSLSSDELSAERNDSLIHKDAVFAGAVTVTATCADNKDIIIFKNGQWQDW